MSNLHASGESHISKASDLVGFVVRPGGHERAMCIECWDAARASEFGAPAPYGKDPDIYRCEHRNRKCWKCKRPLRIL